MNPADFLIDMLDDMKGRDEKRDSDSELEEELPTSKTCYETMVSCCKKKKEVEEPTEVRIFPEKYEFSKSEDHTKLLGVVSDRGCADDISRIERQMVFQDPFSFFTLFSQRRQILCHFGGSL